MKCSTCADIADKAFESSTSNMQEVAAAFLEHVVNDHTNELMGLLAERYAPIFMAKREMR